MLERQIEEYLIAINDSHEMKWSDYSISSIMLWSWKELPYSRMDDYYSRQDQEVYGHIDDLINRAPKNEALTSGSSYIRECKKWFLRNAERS